MNNSIDKLKELSKDECYYIMIDEETVARFTAVIYYKNSIEILTKVALENKIPEYTIDKVRLSELFETYSNALKAIDDLFGEVLIKEFGDNSIATNPQYHLEVDIQQEIVYIRKEAHSRR